MSTQTSSILEPDLVQKLGELRPESSKLLLRSCEMEIERQEHPRWFLGSRVHRTTKNEPLDFESSPFLKPIYQDESPEIVIKKAVQVGISELLICDAFAHADMGLRVFYVLPTIDLRNTFVRDRIDRPLLTVPYYRHRTKPAKKEEAVFDVDNVGLKSFGENGLLFFVGSNSPVSFISFPADVGIVDELDKCLEIQRKQTKNNLALIPDRMVASKHKFMREVSTPTIEGFGIDESYNRSDKKHWLIKCEHCGLAQKADFFTHIVRQSGDNVFELIDQDWTDGSAEDIGVFCKKCGKKINRLSQGEWVAEHPDRHVSGYAVSQLCSDHLTIAKIYDTFLKGLINEYKKQRFYNSILGQAYTSAGAKLSKAMLDECVKLGQFYNLPSKAEHTTMGVDVGNVLHVYICDHQDKKRRLVYAGTVKDFDELHTLIARFGVDECVIDYEPERREAKRFQKDANCKVWLCDYSSGPQEVETKIDYESCFIVADRTQVLDALVADFLSQTILLPANAPSLEGGDFYAQLCASTRVFDETSGQYRWVEGSKPDHFFHAGAYERLANDFFVEPEIAELYAQDKKKQPFPHKKLKTVTR